VKTIEGFLGVSWPFECLGVTAIGTIVVTTATLITTTAAAGRSVVTFAEMPDFDETEGHHTKSGKE
jgi:hypothetical protein